MKVLIIGTGSVGSVIAQHLSQEKSIHSLTLADKDLSRATVISKDSKNNNVEVAKLDASDESELGEVIKEKDVVVNASHPDYNEAIMRQCLRLGVNYVDNANRSIMRQLAQDKDWKNAGLLAVVGLGEDPGLSNIFARHGADQLDSIEEIRIRDGEYSKSANQKNSMVPLFSPRVFFEEILSPAIVCEEGRIKKMPPLSGAEVYEFSEPIGKQTVYMLDHEEVETLPVYIQKGVKYVDFKLALTDQFIATLTSLKDTGMLSTDPVKVDGVEIKPFEVFLSMIPNPMSVAGEISGYAGLVVEVRGSVGGKNVKYALGTQMSHEEAFRRYRANATSLLTGIVPAVFITLLSEGKIEQKGVIPPELLDSRLMLESLARVGVVTRTTRCEESSF